MHDDPSPYRDSLPSEAAYPPAPAYYTGNVRDKRAGSAPPERIAELTARRLNRQAKGISIFDKGERL